MTGASGTTDPTLESWIEVDPRSDFPIQNLPMGVFARDGKDRIGVAIGEQILDLHELAGAGVTDAAAARELLQPPRLNAFLGAGQPVWTKLRELVSLLLRRNGDPKLRDGDRARFFVDRLSAQMRLPVDVGDYVDFYSSIEHATNLGRLFRPNADALLPNWRWIPIGYHGRSSTIVVDGTPIRRPRGQRKAGEDAPEYGPSRRLDIELEMGFFTGAANRIGEPVLAREAASRIFGLVLVNDWSARDIQSWEYQPLGPFLGKSFATTISPWIVSLAALEPFRAQGPAQEPPPLDYLREDAPSAYDIDLEVDLTTASMRNAGLSPITVSRTNFRGLYWSIVQQLTHATSNGAVARAGDLFASGTISGSDPSTQGSFIELSWNGQRPVELPNGETRAFLEDGDEIALRGWCERAGARRIGFGAARGRVEGAAAV